LLLCILGTFLALTTGRRRIGLMLFLVTLLATLLFFGYHVTEPLPLSF
jgi:hypothetical protein